MSILRSRRRPSPIRALAAIILVGLIVVGQSGCRQSLLNYRVPMSVTVRSGSFGQGEDIPARFSCDGANVSPEISWSTLPANTRSLTMIVTDSDSLFGSYVHWLLYNLPPAPTTLAEGVPRGELLPSGARQGLSSDNTIGYTGPCPPGSSPHRYVFTLYALDSILDPQTPVNKKQLINAMKGHVLAAGRLTGRYHH